MSYFLDFLQWMCECRIGSIAYHTHLIPSHIHTVFTWLCLGTNQLFVGSNTSQIQWYPCMVSIILVCDWVQQLPKEFLCLGAGSLKHPLLTWLPWFNIIYPNSMTTDKHLLMALTTEVYDNSSSIPTDEKSFILGIPLYVQFEPGNNLIEACFLQFQACQRLPANQLEQGRWNKEAIARYPQSFTHGCCPEKTNVLADITFLPCL